MGLWSLCFFVFLAREAQAQACRQSFPEPHGGSFVDTTRTFRPWPGDISMFPMPAGDTTLTLPDADFKVGKFFQQYRGPPAQLLEVSFVIMHSQYSHLYGTDQLAGPQQFWNFGVFSRDEVNGGMTLVQAAVPDTSLSAAYSGNQLTTGLNDCAPNQDAMVGCPFTCTPVHGTSTKRTEPGTLPIREGQFVGIWNVNGENGNQPLTLRTWRDCSTGAHPTSFPASDVPVHFYSNSTAVPTCGSTLAAVASTFVPVWEFSVIESCILPVSFATSGGGNPIALKDGDFDTGISTTTTGDTHFIDIFLPGSYASLNHLFKFLYFVPGAENMNGVTLYGCTGHCSTTTTAIFVFDNTALRLDRAVQYDLTHTTLYNALRLGSATPINLQEILISQCPLGAHFTAHANEIANSHIVDQFHSRARGATGVASEGWTGGTWVNFDTFSGLYFGGATSDQVTVADTTPLLYGSVHTVVELSGRVLHHWDSELRVRHGETELRFRTTGTDRVFEVNPCQNVSCFAECRLFEAQANQTELVNFYYKRYRDGTSDRHQIDCTAWNDAEVGPNFAIQSSSIVVSSLSESSFPAGSLDIALEKDTGPLSMSSNSAKNALQSLAFSVMCGNGFTCINGNPDSSCAVCTCDTNYRPWPFQCDGPSYVTPGSGYWILPTQTIPQTASAKPVGDEATTGWVILKSLSILAPYEGRLSHIDYSLISGKSVKFHVLNLNGGGTPTSEFSTDVISSGTRISFADITLLLNDRVLAFECQGWEVDDCISLADGAPLNADHTEFWQAGWTGKDATFRGRFHVWLSYEPVDCGIRTLAHGVVDPISVNPPPYGEWHQGHQVAHSCDAMYVLSGPGSGLCGMDNGLWTTAHCDPRAPNYAYPALLYCTTTPGANCAMLPTVNGDTGPVDSWTSFPALPAGIVLTTNGKLHAPNDLTVEHARSTFSITLSNTMHNQVLDVDIVITAQTPSSFLYSPQQYVLTINEVLNPTKFPSVTARVTQWTVTPPLPGGLEIDSNSGEFRGTPTTLTTSQQHTVKGSNSGCGSQAHLPACPTATITVTVNDVAPSITYSFASLHTFFVGETVNIGPTSISGGAVVSWSFTTTKPGGVLSGVTINSSGFLVGAADTDDATPWQGSISAENSGGVSNVVNFGYKVVHIPPQALSFSQASYTIIAGSTFNETPYIEGGPVSWEIKIDSGSFQTGASVNLGNGLVFSGGSITGTAAVSTFPTQNTFTVRAFNSGGDDHVEVVIRVIDEAPRDLSYSPNPVVFYYGTPDSTVPTSSGGNPTHYNSTPALPLALDFSSGTVAGTMTTLMGLTDYTIAACTEAGCAYDVLQISCEDEAPGVVEYDPMPTTFPQDVIDQDPATTVTGTNLVFSINPALPSGLTLDTASGSITGTLETPFKDTFDVTASNSAGSSAGNITIEVVDIPPSGITYSLNPAFYNPGQTHNNTASVASGGAVVTWAVSGNSLPEGFSLNPNTGEITGETTTTEVDDEFTITATNTGGSDFVELRIVVSNSLTLLYSPLNPVFVIGTARDPLTANLNGGRAYDVAVFDMTQPGGLGLAVDSNGTITGTPDTVGTHAVTVTVETDADPNEETSVELSVTVNDAPPSFFEYTAEDRYFLGSSFELNCSSTGLNLVYSIASISHADSVAIDSETCQLTLLAPLAEPVEITLTLRAQNSGGLKDHLLVLTFVEIQPEIYSYTRPHDVLYATESMATNQPSFDQQAFATPSDWSIAPLLAGVTIDPTSGFLSGVPAAAVQNQTYLVTASNSGGNATYELHIEVIWRAPFLDVFAPPAELLEGGVGYYQRTVGEYVELTADFSSTSTAVWSLQPDFGFAFSAGVINGTVGGVMNFTDTVANLTNLGGSASQVLRFRFVDVAPNSLSYDDITTVATKGVAVASNTATAGGGSVISFSIDNNFESTTGLVFNTNTGEISGTPNKLTGAITYRVSATNTGGSTHVDLTYTINDVMPIITYTQYHFIFIRDSTINNFSPSNTGGAVTSWFVATTPPAGLLIQDGELSGTPIAVTSQSLYTISATNTGGTDEVVLNITVVDVAPSQLQYEFDVYQLTVGVEVSSPATSDGGQVETYNWAPPLPNGLYLSSDGSLSGYPSALTPAANYTITAKNTGGSTTTVIVISVVDRIPAFTYAEPDQYTKGVAIAQLTPLSSGGDVDTWEVSPALPANLIYNTGNGLLSGTPSVLHPRSQFTFTGTNTGGSSSYQMFLTVVDVAPSNASYSVPDAVYRVGQPIEPNVPSSGGGVVVSYSINQLPVGLSLNSSSGIITGTPTTAQEIGATVTFDNTGGTVDVALTFVVLHTAPTGLSYTNITATKGMYLEGVPGITGNSLSWFVTPDLPAGLDLYAADDGSSGGAIVAAGTIKGTPANLMQASQFWITASNTGGNVTSSVWIAVKAVKPSALSYNRGQELYIFQDQIKSFAPTVSGGDITQYSIAPSLPDGLTFNQTSGDITGFDGPESQPSISTFTVTASNSGGETSTQVVIRVLPVGLAYPYVALTVREPLAAPVPSPFDGTVFSIDTPPYLPQGVLLDVTNGTVTGTASAVLEQMSYNVTARNGAQGVPVFISLILVVNDVPPGPWVYELGAELLINTTIEPVVPREVTTEGGVVISYSLLPLPPAGMVFQNATGEITGTPREFSALTEYKLTAMNSGGQREQAFSFSVVDFPATNLQYATADYVELTEIPPNMPTWEGGNPIEWTVGFGSLPVGLELDSATGTISGTPQVSGSATVSIRAVVFGGASTTVEITVSVKHRPPTDLQYTPSSLQLQRNKDYTEASSPVPSNQGGAITLYSPAGLPAGLRLDSGTGLFFGTPEEIGEFNITVTGSNTSPETTEVTITILVLADCDNVETCNGNGVCTAEGLCDCFDQFDGLGCEACAAEHYGPTCTFCLATTTCSGNGACKTSDGGCKCDAGFVGKSCDACLADHYGPQCRRCPGDPDVCSGRGLCEEGIGGTGTCSCSLQTASIRYTGPACQYSTDTCSNHGSPRADGSCACDLAWSGVDCSLCSANHFGPLCKRCVAADTCNDHGTCDSDGACACDAGWAGGFCQTCGTGYYGAECQPCQCTNGECATSGDGTCKCNQGFREPDCLECEVDFWRDGNACTPCACNGNPCDPATGVCQCAQGANCQGFSIIGVEPYPVSFGVDFYVDVTATGTAKPLVTMTTANGGTRPCNVPMVFPYAGNPVKVNCPHETPDPQGPSLSGVSLAITLDINGKVSTEVTTVAVTPPIPLIFEAVDTRGGTMTIIGSGFGLGPQAAHQVVTLNGQTVVPSSWDSGAIVVVAPAGVGTKAVTVACSGQTGTGEYSHYPPTVRSTSTIDSTQAGGIESLTIYGDYFGTGPDNEVLVTLGGAPCPVSSHNETAIICSRPEGQGSSVELTVSVGGQTGTLLVGFPGPTITSVSGCSGGDAGASTTGCITGDTILLSGWNFGTLANQLTVKVGAVECSGLSMPNAHTQVTCSVPAQLESGGPTFDVTLSHEMRQTTGTLTYAGPIITPASIYLDPQPHAGDLTDLLVAGGQLVGFSVTGVPISATSSDISVTYGPEAYPCTGVTVVNPTTITCTTTAGVGGSLRLTVTVYQAMSPPSDDTLSFAAPIWTTLSVEAETGTCGSSTQMTPYVACPGILSSRLGDMIEITGSNFGTVLSQVTVTLEETSTPSNVEVCAVASVSDGVVRCRVPPDFVGDTEFSVVVYVGTPAQEARNGATGYQCRYAANALSLSTVDPSVGVSNNASVALSGTGFVDGMTHTTASGVSCPTRVADPTQGQCYLTRMGVSFMQAWDGGLSSAVIPVVHAPPTITSVVLPAGSSGSLLNPAGAERITIMGSFADVPMTVLVGGRPCRPVTITGTRGSYQATCITPPGWGVVDVSMHLHADTTATDRAALTARKAVTYHPCAPGFYFDLAMDTCSQCPLGSYSSAARLAVGSCTLCPAGRAASTRGSSQCSVCASGFFSNKRGASVCDLCPPGSSSTSVSGTTCLGCVAGQFFSAGVCSPCEPGTFQPLDGQMGCDPCPAGLVSASGYTVCVRCRAGTSAALDGTSCITCEPGTSSVLAGQCEPAPTGWFVPVVDSGVAYPCPPGTTTSGAGNHTCAPCGENLVSTMGGSLGCTQCGDGTVAVGGMQCAACWPGTLAQAGEAECSVCPAGSAGDTPAASSCEACPPGRSNDGVTGQSCDLCPPGYYSNSTDLTPCLPCPAGTVAQLAGKPGSLTCVGCPAGKFAPSVATTTCALCDPGRHSIGGSNATHCPACPAGTFSSGSGAANCTACEPGRHASTENQALCSTCSLGRFSGLPGAVECELCDYGRFQATSAGTQCELCQFGRFAGVRGAKTCLQCLPGQYAELGLCIDCPGGKFIQPGESSCTQCSPGRYQPSNTSTECLPCSPGRYQAAQGQTTCTATNPGQYQPSFGATTWFLCGPGTASTQLGARSCSDCSKGSYSPEGDAQEVRSKCIACVAGRFAASIKSITCEECPRGRYNSQNRGASCDKCPPGRFSNETGLQLCNLCPANTVQAGEGQFECHACQAGTYSERTGVSACVLCQPGTFSNVSDKPCVDCPAGSYSPVPGATTCFTASRGHFAPLGASQQYNCPPGTIAPAAGMGACEACPVGKVQRFERGTECTDCPVGKVSGEGGAGCNSCPTGEAPVNNTCASCPAGQFSRGEGVPCMDCPEGRFNAQERQGACLDCAVGKYSSSTGAQACLPCETGTFNGGTGISACDLCDAGRFSSEEATACTNCGLGRYSAQNASECLPCPAGKFQDELGGSKCRDCQPGYRSDEAAERCVGCLAFSVAPKSGAVRCQQCVGFSVQSSGDVYANDDHTACVCGEGFFEDTSHANSTINLEAEGEVRVDCVRCPDGANCAQKAISFTSLQTRDGWWRLNGTTTFYQCRVHKYCFANGCASNRQGVLCQLCAPGHTTDSDGSCTKCAASSSGQILEVAGLAALVLLFVTVFYVWMLRKETSQQLVVLMKLQETGDVSKDIYSTLVAREQYLSNLASKSALSEDQEGVRLQIVESIQQAEKYDAGVRMLDREARVTHQAKVAVGFFQVAVVLATHTSVPWPRAFKQFLSLFYFINFDFVSASKAGCLTDYYSGLVVRVCLPFALILGVCLFYGVPKGLAGCFCGNWSDMERKGKTARLMYKLQKLAWFTLFLSYPFVSTSILQPLACVEVDGVLYMSADFSVHCGEALWWSWFPFSIAGTVLFAFGVPFLLFLKLCRNRNHLETMVVRFEVGFMYEMYDRRVWYFEVVDMSHKFILTAVLPFFELNVQMIVALLVILSHTCLILWRNPYGYSAESRKHDRLHLLSQTCLLLICMAGLVFQTLDRTEVDEWGDYLMSAVLIVDLLIFSIMFLSAFWVRLKEWGVKLSKLGSLLLGCCKKDAAVVKDPVEPEPVVRGDRDKIPKHYAHLENLPSYLASPQ